MQRTAISINAFYDSSKTFKKYTTWHSVRVSAIFFFPKSFSWGTLTFLYLCLPFLYTPAKWLTWHCLDVECAQWPAKALFIYSALHYCFCLHTCVWDSGIGPLGRWTTHVENVNSALKLVSPKGGEKVEIVLTGIRWQKCLKWVSVTQNAIRNMLIFMCTDLHLRWYNK